MQSSTKRQSSRTDSRKRILLVEDHAVVRFGVAQLINRQGDLVVCDETENASQAMSIIERSKPDLVLSDISLKESSGLELMRNIKAQFPALPVIVLSVHDEALYAEVAMIAVSNVWRRSFGTCSVTSPAFVCSLR